MTARPSTTASGEPLDWAAVETRARAEFSRKWRLENERPFRGDWETRFEAWYQNLIDEAAPVFGFALPDDAPV